MDYIFWCHVYMFYTIPMFLWMLCKCGAFLLKKKNDMWKSIRLKMYILYTLYTVLKCVAEETHYGLEIYFQLSSYRLL